jgi:hypothetical protein
MPVTTPSVQTISTNRPIRIIATRSARGLNSAAPADRVIEAEDLVERAERQEQQDEPVADDSATTRRRHSRSLMMSATRSALAMIVSVGFTAPIDGKKLASVM